MWNDFTYDELLKVSPVKKPCFLAGTLVSTESGPVPIEDIPIGEQVYARNMVTGLTELKRVTQTFTNYAEKYIRIGTAGDTVCATGQHRFWLPVENRWCMANSLQVGMSMLSHSGGEMHIQSLEIIADKVDTYNLEVEDHHNYHVSRDEILAHNQSINPKSIFYRTDTIDVKFYELLDRFQNFEPLYVGQTIQEIGKRYDQHKRDPKKPWMRDSERNIGGFEIYINGKPGPHKMTPYEAAVVEMYEIYKNGAREGRDPGGKLKNKQRPISLAKFTAYKNLAPPRDFNPCRFFV